MKTWTEEMGEISGFGGSYEAGCRAMVLAGIQWIDEHPDGDPQFHGYNGVYGLIMEDNEDAKSLTRAIMDAPVTMEDGTVTRAGKEATGAMHQAAVGNVLAYKRLGWDEYCRQRINAERAGEREAESKGPRA